MSVWRAYTSIEYAILDLKLRWGTDQMLSTGNGIGMSKSKLRRKRKEQEQQMNSIDLVKSVRTKLEKLNLDSEKQLLLQELRSCRDILKMLVKSY